MRNRNLRRARRRVQDRQDTGKARLRIWLREEMANGNFYLQDGVYGMVLIHNEVDAEGARQTLAELGAMQAAGSLREDDQSLQRALQKALSGWQAKGDHAPQA